MCLQIGPLTAYCVSAHSESGRHVVMCCRLQVDPTLRIFTQSWSFSSSLLYFSTFSFDWLSIHTEALWGSLLMM